MNESHIVLTLKEYKELMETIEIGTLQLSEHLKITEDTFAVTYDAFKHISNPCFHCGAETRIKAPTFYTKKELHHETIEMFDTLQGSIKELQDEIVRFKNMGFTERIYRWVVKDTFMDLK